MVLLDEASDSEDATRELLHADNACPALKQQGALSARGICDRYVDHAIDEVSCGEGLGDKAIEAFA